MDDDRLFRLHAVVSAAIEPDPGGDEEPALPVSGRLAAERARVAVSRVTRTDTELKEVAVALLEALRSLEEEVERLRQRLQLSEIGIELQKELVHIGGDGLTMQRPVAHPPGTAVRVWLELPVSGHETLMCVAGTIEPAEQSGHTAIRFDRIASHQRDRLVAFVFQQQAKERRRARSPDAD